MSAPIVFLDTETDGVHPGRKVWEVAMIRRFDGVDNRMEFFVEIDLSTADPFGLKVGGFYGRHPLGRYLSGIARTPFEGMQESEFRTDFQAAREVARFTHGAHLAGIVPNFDAEVLANLLRASGLTPAWHYHLIDVETLAVSWLNGIAAHGHSSVACSDSPIDCAVAEDEQEQLLTLPWSSEAISRAIGVEPPPAELRHTAMGDADWALRIYDRIFGGAL
ncbi:hypothetical protein ACIBG0_38795 [Nocardia sp. NPDC050630]|uniref:hypothetical protein n=1 Tax=Nocardia sp. NPDC050630 TaxID=3364321 RepID=UPI00378B349D